MNIKSIILSFLLVMMIQLVSAQIDQNYYYRLTNTFLGEGRSLDTYSGKTNEPFMGKTGNYSGQFWILTKIKPIQ